MEDIRNHKQWITFFNKTITEWQLVTFNMSIRGGLFHQLSQEGKASLTWRSPFTNKDVSASFQRWKTAEEALKETLTEANDYYNINITPLTKMVASSNGGMMDTENKTYILESLKKASNFYKGQLKTLEQLLANVAAYPTLQAWENYKQKKTQETGTKQGELTTAKQDIIGDSQNFWQQHKIAILITIASLAAFYFIRTSNAN